MMWKLFHICSAFVFTLSLCTAVLCKYLCQSYFFTYLPVRNLFTANILGGSAFKSYPPVWKIKAKHDPSYSDSFELISLFVYRRLQYFRNTYGVFSQILFQSQYAAFKTLAFQLNKIENPSRLGVFLVTVFPRQNKKSTVCRCSRAKFARQVFPLCCV